MAIVWPGIWFYILFWEFIAICMEMSCHVYDIKLGFILIIQAFNQQYLYNKCVKPIGVSIGFIYCPLGVISIGYDSGVVNHLYLIGKFLQNNDHVMSDTD